MNATNKSAAYHVTASASKGSGCYTGPMFRSFLTVSSGTLASRLLGFVRDSVIAALLGAHIIKIKLSTDALENKDAKKVYQEQGIDISTQAKRVEHCMQAAFGGRQIVVFSGGAAKGSDAVYEDAIAIRDGGGNGSIIGRNSFQRSREDALAMLGKLVDIYLGKA